MRHNRDMPPGRPAGGFPVVGDVGRLARSGTAVTIAERVGHDSLAVAYRAVAGGDQVAVSWYRHGLDTGRQRQEVAALAADASPHSAFAWPIDIVECAGVRGFGYATRWIPERFVPLLSVLVSVEGPLRTLAWIGAECAAAFAALHARGLRFRAFGFGSLRVDPGRGDVVILFDDKIGPEGEDVSFYGTVSFMAPELVRGEAGPSAASDRHSLAVLLFYLLMRGHPLEGNRAIAWDDNDGPDRVYSEPLFVFDPDDNSNAPAHGDPVLAWWPIYPRFVRGLFTRAFTSGLTDASPAGRVTAHEWHQAMTRLADCASWCSCQALVIWDPDDPQSRCWNCGLVPAPPPLLELAGRSLVLSEGAVLTSGHLSAGDDRTPRGLVQRHPTAPGELVLRNLGDAAWAAEPAGEEHKTVPPGRAIRVRPMVITFGAVRCSIRAPERPA